MNENLFSFSTYIIPKLAQFVKTKMHLLQLLCCHYHHDIKCQDKNAESIILCLKYYFRLSPLLSDYGVYAMTIFLTWMVCGGERWSRTITVSDGWFTVSWAHLCSVSPYLV